MHLCMIRFEEQLDMETIELDKELDMMDKILGMKTTSECAREEREAGARQILKKTGSVAKPGPRPGIPSQGPT